MSAVRGENSDRFYPGNRTNCAVNGTRGCPGLARRRVRRRGDGRGHPVQPWQHCRPRRLPWPAWLRTRTRSRRPRHRRRRQVAAVRMCSVKKALSSISRFTAARLRHRRARGRSWSRRRHVDPPLPARPHSRPDLVFVHTVGRQRGTAQRGQAASVTPGRPRPARFRHRADRGRMA
jgi:hypothetical protein